MKLEFSGQIFQKHSIIKSHEKPSSGSRVVPCGRTDGLTDMTKLIVAFGNFANSPKISNKINLMLTDSKLLFFTQDLSLEYIIITECRGKKGQV